ncbi:MAG: OmpA family protein [Spirosomataceae bacterium]
MTKLVNALLFVCLIATSGCVPMWPTNYPGNGGGNSGGNNPPSQPTPAPTPVPTSNRGITVNNIRLTDQYTILDLTFFNNARARYDQTSGRMISDGSQPVAFHVNAELIAMQGARHFKLVNVEGLPTNKNFVDLQRNGHIVKAGQSVSFTVYFERLDRGIETFDMFECQDADTYTCWNQYNLYVSNPAPVVTQTPPPPTSKPQSTPSNLPPTQTPPVVTKPKDSTPTNPQPEAKVPKMTPKGIWLTGIVRDAKTKEPITAKLNFQQSPSLVEVDSVQSFQESGTYRIRLDAGQVYTFAVTSRGYLVVTDVVDLSKTPDGQTIKKDILLKPFEVGDKVTLQNIYFEMSKADILEASFAELDKLVRMMKENPSMRIRLEGHTDIVGDPVENLKLSQQRVDNVKEYLMKKGISGARIETIGHGSKYPILKKGTDEERRVNRRVEFVILNT